MLLLFVDTSHRTVVSTGTLTGWHSVMHEICGEFFIFQQGNVPAHRAPRQSTFWNETPAFISSDLSPPNNTDLNPIDYNIWGEIQQLV